MLLRRFTLTVLLTVATGLLVPTSACQAGVTYQITVNTSGVSGTGYLDLEFNPATVGTTPAATATVTGLTGYTGSLGAPQLNGTATGDPSSTLTLANTGAFNAYSAAVTFGASLQFLLNLDGPAFSATSTDGSSFLFALYNSAGDPLNGSADPTVALLNLTPDGVNPGVTIDIVTGPAFSGGPDATVVTAVPEASTVAMGGLVAVAGLIAAWRGRRSAA